MQHSINKGNIMAKSNGAIKLPRKKAPKVHNPLNADEAFTGPEPKWSAAEAAKMTQPEFDHRLRESMYYYNYYYSVKQLKPLVIKWLQANTKMSAAEITQYKLSPDYATPMTACSIVKSHYMGMPMQENHIAYIMSMANKCIKGQLYTEDEPNSDIKKVGNTPTIQDRINEKVSGIIGEIDGQIDLIFTNKVPDMKVFDYITTNKVPQAAIGKIRVAIQRYTGELFELSKGDDEQLTEAYSFLSKKDIKRIQTYLDSIQADLDSYAQVKKITKQARKPKPANKEKLVSKVKYMKEDKGLKVVSMAPINILGAQECWVFNIKTRKIGVYYAESHGGALSIKGTTIINYDEAKSVCKTIRKPEEKLKEFFKTGKVALRNFMKDINATETKLNGRLGLDTLILKVA